MKMNRQLTFWAAKRSLNMPRLPREAVESGGSVARRGRANEEQAAGEH